MRPVYTIGAFGHEEYEHWAGRLLAAAQDGDADAVFRLRRHVPRLAGADVSAVVTEADARVCRAHEYGFRGAPLDTRDARTRHPTRLGAAQWPPRPGPAAPSRTDRMRGCTR